MINNTGAHEEHTWGGGGVKPVENVLKSWMLIAADEIIFSAYAKLDSVLPPVVRPSKLNQRIVSVFLQANKSRLIDLRARHLPGWVALKCTKSYTHTSGYWLSKSTNAAGLKKKEKKVKLKGVSLLKSKCKATATAAGGEETARGANYSPLAVAINHFHRNVPLEKVLNRSLFAASEFVKRCRRTPRSERPHRACFSDDLYVVSLDSSDVLLL